ncbi:MAG: MBL fold metallo-hydrolase [Solirubrobacteraceae bacterium]|jgi:hydroxyacylglutathione hydrolase|nr:MBL fold metallo-hydrolase [Solirubrobacteraceae bacterium]MDP4672867.1 MBL fold metallo-hydrolase [Solirubrobacteraceae bacterium]MDP4920618.1 MBL fold metallo-hydrolase [Solirubrobacteraceae bacterium]MDP5033970.1 MBL fold metallo-hydrolase [Solirubrobacteraceae bacterium]
MIIESSELPDFLTNTYLVGEPGGAAFFVDAGGPVEPLIEAAERHGMTPTHVLLTHHHYDHVCDLEALLGAYPGIEVLIHPAERAEVPAATGDLIPGAPLSVGPIEITVLHTPGHTAGMCSLLVEDQLFTGDTLFKGSVGGVRAPGSTSYADLHSSIMETLMTLPPETVVNPGHSGATTIGEEWEGNGFIRIWRGLDDEGSAQCLAMGDPATLILLGDDYDGGHKAWVRWPDGSDDLVPGSQIADAA